MNRIVLTGCLGLMLVACVSLRAQAPTPDSQAPAAEPSPDSQTSAPQTEAPPSPDTRPAYTPPEAASPPAQTSAPPVSMPDSHTFNHGEIGVYGDYFRVSSAGTDTNYLGIGGRVGFNFWRYAAIEAEINYDFEQNRTVIVTNGTSTTTTYTARIRPITGLFGPKFQVGGSSPVRIFIEGKAGFVDFSNHCDAPAGSVDCFSSSLSGFGGDSTHFAAFPGGGIEFFAGPFGMRAEAGDELWVNNGTYNNLRVTFGPAIRF